MPHIHLDTTADLTENAAIPDILEAFVARLCSFETIASKSVKAYHTLRSNWSMGEGAPPGFAHLRVEIMDGRDLELRNRIADGMWEEMRQQFAGSLEAEEVLLTVEIRQMESETYRK